MFKLKANPAGLYVAYYVMIAALLFGSASFAFSQTYPFQDKNQTLETRVSDLLSRLTQAEKISLIHQWEPAISRLGIGPFRTGTEALHGIAWLGNATVFPQVIGLGSTWDPALIKQIGSAIGDEARAFNKRNPTNYGLSLWAPVVDLERDPRAGRFEEGYSEDPFLVARMAIAYCNGIKGDDPFYYKAIPTLKHFYAYNQEANRDVNNVSIDSRNANEYYLKSFRLVIQSGMAKSMMTSYNLVNGVPCTVSPEINNSVKSKWVPSDFFIVTDAYAPANLAGSQKYYADMPHAYAGMIRAGVDSMTQDDNNPANMISAINTALTQNLLTTADIDKTVRNILTVRFHTGEFDVPVSNPYSSLPDSEICASDHAALSLKAAREGIVLLKNTNKILPISKSSSVALIGPMANVVLTDFYSGTCSYKVTPLDGIKKKVSTVNYAADNTNNAAVNAAKASTVAVVCVGNDPLCGDLGWAVPRYPSEGKEAVDRQTITFESSDENLIKAVYAANPNTIVVLVSSFPYAMTWENSNVPGIVFTCHAGQELGNALADVLFGDYNPGGKLASTWYSSLSQIPAINNYDIINGKRTYMYFDGTPLYPFGYGLSYATFTYSNLRLDQASVPSNGQVSVSIDVKNSGTVSGDEIVQLYAKARQASVKTPLKQLVGFSRVSIAAGATATASMTFNVSELAYWDATKNALYVEPGNFDIMAGSSSADIRLTATLSVTDASVTALPTAAVTPAPTSVTGIVGDANGNGTIDIVDALLIAQYYVGLNPSGFIAANADTDCSGSIDIVDALLVAQYYVGIITQFC
jgi:beta-glucosidase